MGCLAAISLRRGGGRSNPAAISRCGGLLLARYPRSADVRALLMTSSHSKACRDLANDWGSI